MLPESISLDFLDIEREGRKLYEKVIEERIVGSRSIWDTINKRKLPTFANNKKVVTVKIRKQLINIKAETKPMSRFTVASRSRPDIDLPGYLGKYEFPAVPRSIFTGEGDLIWSEDKSTITSECSPIESADADHKVIVFDGSCSEFASAYVQKVEKEAQWFDKIRVIFDRYTEEYLKSATRTGRTGMKLFAIKFLMTLLLKISLLNNFCLI